MTRWNVVVDQELCIGTGTCIATAPERFAYDAHQRSSPGHATIQADDSVLDAAASCPLQAIAVTDADTGKPIDSL